MAFSWETNGNAPTPNVPKATAGAGFSWNNQPAPTPKLVAAETDAAVAKYASDNANGFVNIAKNTIGGIVDVGKNFLSNLWGTYSDFPSKAAEDIKSGAPDIQAGMDKGGLAGVPDALKGEVKAGGRLAGDAAGAVFAPISAALSAVLNQNGGQKLTDSAGKVIADHSGITDIPAFQKFAMAHPSAGEDFGRFLNLAMSAGEGEEIEPSTILDRTKLQVADLSNKIASKITAPPVEVAPAGEAAIPPTPPVPPVVGETAPPQGKTGFTWDKAAPTENAPETAPKVVVPPAEEALAEAPANPDKTSGVAKSIADKAIEKNLTDSFNELAGYESKTVADQASRVTDLISKDPEQMRAIVSGDKPLPAGMSGSMFLKGVEEHATLNGDVGLIRDLASSPLTSETSIHAQELRFLAEREQSSAVQAIKDVAKARDAKLQGKDVTTEKGTIIDDIQKSVKKSAPTAQTWGDFIESIKC